MATEHKFMSGKRAIAIIVSIAMVLTGFAVPFAYYSTPYSYAKEAEKIKEVKIEGDPTVGETLTAKVLNAEGDEITEGLTYKWQEYSSYYDELEEGMVDEYTDIPKATEKTLLLTDKLEKKDIVVEVKGKGSANTKLSKSVKIKQKQMNTTQAYLKKIVDSVPSRPLEPIYGKDINVLALMKAEIEKKHGSESDYQGVELSVLSSSQTEAVENNGDIHYFYKDISSVSVKAPGNNSWQPEITFKLTKGTDSVNFKKKANIYWDIAKLSEDLKTKVLGSITEEIIKGENTSLTNIDKAWELPGRFEDKRYATVKYETDKPDALKIENIGSLSEPKYKFTPLKVHSDTPVKLYAIIESYSYTNSEHEDEEIKKCSKEFDLVVKGQGAAIEQEKAKAQKELDDNYTIEKLTYINSGNAIDPNHVKGSIQLLKKSDTGVTNYTEYNVPNVIVSDSKYIKVNGYRADIVRPLHGQAAKNVEFTVQMVKKDDPSFVISKKFAITIEPLGPNDLSDAKKLIEKVKASYFDGIKGSNQDKDNITSDLHGFQEAYLDKATNSLVWVKEKKDLKGIGVIPVDVPGYDPMVNEGARLFKSSKPSIIKHENLILNSKPTYNTEVKIESVLSVEPFIHYLETYPDNEDIKAILKQPVSVNVKVKGTKGEAPNEPQQAKTVTIKMLFSDVAKNDVVGSFGELKVKSGLAKAFGYTGSAVDEHAIDGQVTILDALVAHMAEKLNIKEPTAENQAKIKKELVVEDSGWITKIGDAGSNVMYFVNYTSPHTDEFVDSKKDEYMGTVTNNSILADGDIFTLAAMKTPYGSQNPDKFTWFEKDEKKVKEISVPKGENVKLTLKGYRADVSLKIERIIKENTKPIAGAELAIYDASAKKLVRQIGKISNQKGEINVAFDEAKEYWISALGSNDVNIIAPILKVKVTNGVSQEQREQIVDEDLAKLTFDQIKGGNSESEKITSDLKLIDAGKSGKTTIKWESSAKDVISDNGKVIRPLNETGDKTVKLTATISYGDVSKTKSFDVKVLKLPTSSEALDELILKLPKKITVKEYDSSKTNKQDINVILLVRDAVKKLNPLADVENTCTPSAEQTQISQDGTITYGTKNVREKDVEFTITLGSISKKYKPLVSVGRKEVTKAEVFAGDWLDEAYIQKLDRGKNKVFKIDGITSDFLLPQEGDIYSDLTWTSSNTEVISIKDTAANKAFAASVSRPLSSKGDVEVELTCKIQPGTMWAYAGPAGPTPDPNYGIKKIKVIVKAATAEEEAAAGPLLEEAIKLFDLSVMTVRGTKEKLDLENITYHFNDHPMNWNYVNKKPGFKPEFKEIKIEWKSENPGIVKLGGVGDIKRTDQDQKGDIVLILKYNGITKERRWHTCVKALGAKELSELNASTRSFAEKLNFDVIKGENNERFNITKDIKLYESAVKQKGDVVFKTRKSYHEEGVNIKWTSSDDSILRVEFGKIGLKKKPEKNTVVSLVAELTNIKFANTKGVNQYTKTINVVVPGTNDSESPEVTLKTYEENNKSKFDEAKDLAKTIIQSYLHKDLNWWGKQDSFWGIVAVQSYAKDIDSSLGSMNQDQKQAVCDIIIKKNIEGVTFDSKKASSEANALQHAITALSAMGYDSTEVVTGTGEKLNAVQRLSKIKLEDAKKGWFATIAPYVLNGLNQTEAASNELKNEYIAYLLGELKNANYSWGVDTPAMIIQGLAPYYHSNAAVKTEIDAALAKISEKQGKNGSFGNANADAMVLVALAQLGINPERDERFLKNDHNLIEGILNYSTSAKDGFKFGSKDAVNDYATAQGIIGLIAAIRAVETENVYNIYDFSKVAKQKGAFVKMPTDNVELDTVIILPKNAKLNPNQAGEYSYKLAADVAGAKIKAVPANFRSTVVIDGETVDAEKAEWTSKLISVKNGESKDIVIKVTSEDKKNNKEYVFKLSREEKAAQPQVQPDTINVKFELVGDTKHYKDENNKGSHEPKVWIANKTVTVPKDSTVKYVTDKELLNANLDFVTKNRGTYISKIKMPGSNEYLGEFDNGPNSGWMYRHNGKIADEGYADRVLKSGDSVKWFYTDDYTKEKGYEGNWDHVNSKAAQTEKKEEPKIEAGDVGKAIVAGKVETKATVDAKTGTAKATVSNEKVKEQLAQIDKALEQAKKDSKVQIEKALTINVKTGESAKSVETTLPKSVLSQVNGKIDSLVIATDKGNIKLDDKIIKNLANTGLNDVSITITQTYADAAITGKLDENLKAKIENRPMIEVIAKNGNEILGNIGGKVEITVPYKKAPQEKDRAIVLFKVKEDGNLTLLPKASLEKGEIAFENNGVNAKVVVAYNPKEFGDSNAHWANQEIEFLAAREVINGKGEAKFDPNGEVSRAEFMQILGKLSGEDMNKYATTKFADVDSNSWYAHTVAWGAASGLTSGMGDGTFMPNAPISKQDMAVIIERYLNHKGETLKTKNKEVSFGDGAQIANYAKNAVASMQKAGIITGAQAAGGKTVFNPNSQASRAEAAAMMCKYLKN